ncbi:MAG: hypothetical protein LBE06_03485 [Azoarcus sp.]|jgi:hypothetical protein|nr:hypothetical protein [Azoarcus sp.]
MWVAFFEIGIVLALVLAVLWVLRPHRGTRGRGGMDMDGGWDGDGGRGD